LLDGPCKEFDANGQLLFDGCYSFGRRQNACKEFDANGQLLIDGCYNFGRCQNGSVKEFQSNGMIKFEGSYKDGQKHGPWKEYFCNGFPRFLGSYNKGHHVQSPWNTSRFYTWPVGEMTLSTQLPFELSWPTEGLQVEDFDDDFFHNQDGPYKEFYANGNVKFEGSCYDGKKHGRCKEFNFYGQLLSDLWYKNGIKNGEFKEFYANGNVKCKGYNDNRYGCDRPSYTSEHFDENGQLVFFGNYSKGECCNGTEFYANGIVKFKGSYNHGKKHGPCTEFYENGIIKFEGSYGSGRKDGLCKEFDENGQLVFEGVCKLYGDDFSCTEGDESEDKTEDDY
jgi:antitoxin component YwqK of YwqJK toxin-antitoxin module